MRRLTFYFTIVLFVFSTTVNAQSQYAKNITIESVKAHIDTLASESMKGRDTGSEGMEMAVQYISNIFNELELKSPFQDNYFQPFNLYKYKNGVSTIQNPSYLYFPSVYSGSKDVNDSIIIKPVFAGFGSPKDFENLDTKNKIITFIADDVKSALECINQNLKPNKPNYFIVALPSGKINFKDSEIQQLNSFIKLYVFDYYAQESMMDSIELQKFRNTYSVFTDLRINSDEDIRVFFITQNWLTALFGKDAKDLIRISKENQKSNKNLLNRITGFEIQLQIDFSPRLDTITTKNVVGYIEGSELKNEYVIVGAHYDHVGVNSDSTINYGADDNASGTGAVLELAKQFMQAKRDGVKFKRSILFVTFAAEEKGLFGSTVFNNNQPTQLGKIHLLINMDMIGRNNSNKEKYNNTIFVTGWKGGNKYKKIARQENRSNTNLRVDFTPGLKKRFTWKYSSDHYPFATKNIPVLVFFTGLHPDYHTPRDTPDKINYDKYHRIVKLIFETTWEVVNK
ncbi:MAG: hypothetical protein A2W99_05020 [Bacteroidetes bacterium GWF2_33_16]|nr:MAG: hypothetical protein A2X00_17540 [Bacteroidetes bacterium GWE2_32_14]OFY06028.1 MAG: hypothetical protein A2W99_05020 [Bacteroidetes bacterium GWF2_33_16]